MCSSKVYGTKAYFLPVVIFMVLMGWWYVAKLFVVWKCRFFYRRLFIIVIVIRRASQHIRWNMQNVHSTLSTHKSNHFSKQYWKDQQQQIRRKFIWFVYFYLNIIPLKYDFEIIQKHSVHMHGYGVLCALECEKNHMQCITVLFAG